MRNSVSVMVYTSDEVVEYFEKDKGDSCHIYKEKLLIDNDSLIQKIKGVVRDKEVTIKSFKESYIIKVFEKQVFDVPEYTLPRKLDKKEVHDFITQLYKAYETRDGVRLTKEQFNTVFGKTQYGLSEKDIHAVARCLDINISVRPWNKKAGLTAFITDMAPLKNEKEYVPHPPKLKSGVYLISDGEFQKIGITSDIDRRLSALQTSNARQLELIGLYAPKKYAENLEYALHQHFSEVRLKGEWFNLNLTHEEFTDLCSNLEEQDD